MDIWSVGCTVIEMATGKMPFHKGNPSSRIDWMQSISLKLVANTSSLLMKLGNERQAPEIPAELSESAKDFLTK